MRKYQVFSIITALFIFGFAASAPAAEIGKDWKIGVGCEGMYAGPLVQGASVRAWTGPLGMEGNIFTGNAKAQVDTAGNETSIEVKGDVWAFGAKGMYALVQKKNSNFYAGAQINYATFKADLSVCSEDEEIDAKIKGTAWTYGPFMGAEFNFEEAPEIGINLEVGYMLNNAKMDIEADSEDVADAKLYLNGINVSLGFHYYF